MISIASCDMYCRCVWSCVLECVAFACDFFHNMVRGSLGLVCHSCLGDKTSSLVADSGWFRGASMSWPFPVAGVCPDSDVVAMPSSADCLELASQMSTSVILLKHSAVCFETATAVPSLSKRNHTPCCFASRDIGLGETNILHQPGVPLRYPHVLIDLPRKPLHHKSCMSPPSITPRTTVRSVRSVCRREEHATM